MKRNFWSVLFGVLFLSASAFGQGYWGSWPEKCDPKDVGRRLAQNLVDRKDFFKLTKGGLFYPEVCTSYGSLRFANEIKDNELRDKIIARYKDILNEDGMSSEPTPRRLVHRPTNVDASVFGILPLEIYLLTGDKRYLELGLKSADGQWEAKPTTRQQATMDELKIPAGLTPQTRFWIDDMFMITAIQTQAYRATKDAKYIDRTAKEMVAYLDKLQQPNGLFFHGDNAEHYWGRGNGWVAVGMAELLSSLPEDHPQRARIMESYKKMMAALVKYQAPTGMWLQLIDNDQSWPESSCTGMFTFAIGMGVRNGWLDEKEYKEPAKKAWVALCGYIDENANVKEVCIGTNKKPEVQYYLDRPRDVGDMHGQAGAVWAAWALIR